MYLAAVMGAVRDLDRSFVSCLKGYEIYLKDAMLMEGAEALTETGITESTLEQGAIKRQMLACSGRKEWFRRRIPS